MQSEFTAIIEEAPEGGHWATCPEVPGANGQGEAIEATKQNLRSATLNYTMGATGVFICGLTSSA